MIAPSKSMAKRRPNVVNRLFRAMFYVSLVVAIVAGAWFATSYLCSHKVNTAKERSKRGLIAEVAPDIGTQNKPTKPTESETVKAPATESHSGMRLASNGVWQPANRPYRAGRKKAFGVVTNDTQYRAQTVAKNGTEQMMLAIFSRERGDMPLPLPMNLPEKDLENLVGILLSKDEISEEDSESVALDKDTLVVAKEAMMNFLKEDPDANPHDFLQYYHDELTRCYFLRTDAQRFVFKAAEDGESEEVISGLVEKMNKNLEEQGIKPIDNPFDVVRDSAEYNATKEVE